MLNFLVQDLINWNMNELVHPGDKSKASVYLRDMLSGSGSTESVSPIYRLRVQDKYVHVQTKSKFFKCANNSESDFVMATHSIISDNDVANAEASSPHSCSGQSSGSVGGPLMGSVNGPTRTIGSNDTSAQMTLNSGSYTNFTSESALNYEFMEFRSTPLGELGILPSDERIWERPESRHSTPTPSPHTSFVPTQPSPYQNSITFPFSPLGDQPPPLEDTKDRKDASVENGNSSEGDSDRLRRLLTTNKPKADSDDGGGSNKHQHQVLKSLLNPEEDEEGNKNQHPSSNPPPPKVSSGNNNMLLKVTSNVLASLLIFHY